MTSRKSWVMVAIVAVMVGSGVMPKMVRDHHKPTFAPVSAGIKADAEFKARRLEKNLTKHLSFEVTGVDAFHYLGPCSLAYYYLGLMAANYGAPFDIDPNSYSCGSEGCSFDIYEYMGGDWRYFDGGFCSYDV